MKEYTPRAMRSCNLHVAIEITQYDRLTSFSFDEARAADNICYNIHIASSRRSVRIILEEHKFAMGIVQVEVHPPPQRYVR